MLISYPILPTGANDQAEDARFNAMLALAQNNRGLYPITTGNRWHGGIHLTLGDEPIRAIADGVVVAYRMAPDTKNYPQQGAYDTSFILIKHETESGENTRVIFYSLYMHLKPRSLLTQAQREQLPQLLRDALPSDTVVRPSDDNSRIWRKEALGFGGQLYGHPTVHFEIFATEADFTTFWRDRATIVLGQHGSNDVFGDTHFLVPPNLQFAQRHPRAIAPHRIDLPGNNAFYDLEPGQTGQNTESLHVVVELNNGIRTATTYRLDDYGQVVGQIGDPVAQQDYEYELYRLATALYPDCPSAGFEYLRFGRILGPDTTTRIENWQLIRYSDTEMGYINLADPANQISVLSDADFPLRWQRLEEGDAASPNDGMANIGQLSQLLQLPVEPSRTSLFAPADFATRANAAGAAETLHHFICKHPSEWDASDLETRYATLRQPGKPLYGETPWKSFKDHVEAMAFWPQTGLAERSVWHFHPLQFIRNYRKCLWLSSNEFARCIPRNSRQGQVSWTTAIARARIHSTPYSKYIRKYCGHSRKRLAHNLAQSYIETGLLRTITEGGRGNTYPYGPFYGRGYHQLTWAGNFRDYGNYKALPDVTPGSTYSDNRITSTSTHPTAGGGAMIIWYPRYDPGIVENDLDHAGESSGFFWVSKSFRGRKNMNRVCDLNFNESTVGFNCWLINGGRNGYAHRQQFAKFLANILFDEPLLTGSVQFHYPPLNPPGNPALCATFPPANVAATLNETVHYALQVP